MIGATAYKFVFINIQLHTVQISVCVKLVKMYTGNHGHNGQFNMTIFTSQKWHIWATVHVM